MYILKSRRPALTGRRHRFQRWLLALALAPILGTAAAFYQLPRAQAGSTGPIIHWDQSMIYPGHNNGNPWGPVGEPAAVHGEGFTAGQQLKLIVVPGNSDNDAGVCHPASFNAPYAAVVGQVTVSSSGTFDTTFAWPGGIGQSSGSGVTNSICSLSSADNAVISSRDDGPFTVLTQNRPSFHLSEPGITAGLSITVTGQGWVPPQKINIVVGACADCGAGAVASTQATSSGLNSGKFSVTLPIPANTAPGDYVVNVFTPNGPLDAYHMNGVGVQHLTVAAPQATPTATATAAPSPTTSATATPGATPTAITTGSSAGSSGNGGGNGPLLIVLAAIAVVILAIGGLLFFMFTQRKKQASASPPGPSSRIPGVGQFNQYNSAGSPMTPFPPGQPVNGPGPFSNVSNQTFPDYHQGYAQPWQDNQYGNAGFNNGYQNQPSQQGYFAPGGVAAPMNRLCVRCGNPMAFDDLVCGNCGTRNPSFSDPSGPTMAY